MVSPLSQVLLSFSPIYPPLLLARVPGPILQCCSGGGSNASSRYSWETKKKKNIRKNIKVQVMGSQVIGVLVHNLKLH